MQLHTQHLFSPASRPEDSHLMVEICQNATVIVLHPHSVQAYINVVFAGLFISLTR